LMQALAGRPYTLQEYENLSYLVAPEVVQERGLQKFWKTLSTRQITNVGDLQNSSRMAESLRAQKWNAVIRHSRQINARELRTGNFIVLGSSFSNPWAGLLAPQNASFVHDDARPMGRPSAVLNRRPLKGEPSIYEEETDATSGKRITFARIYLVSNLNHTGRALLVAGTSMSSTELAGEFLVDNKSLNSVRRMLNLPVGASLPEFEMVLRVTELNETGNSIQLMACHPLGGS
jgi:hypothetical protein